jgi:hypothetical protein
VLSGTGIRPGVRLNHVENVDVAPTVARLLGLAEFNTDGHVLNEALVPQ